MDRSIREIELDFKVAQEMSGFHRDRLSHYDAEILKLTMELNRARRLEREELQT